MAAGARHKKINFNTSFNAHKHLFICEQHEAAEKIASYYGIDLRDVILYSVRKDKKSRIAPDAISDFEYIEIVSRNGQRSIEDSFENATTKKFVDGIITKLRQNTPLTGTERKALIEALETHSTAVFKKKLTVANQPAQVEKPEMTNKKLQVFMPGKNSFAQTDAVMPVINVEKPVNNETSARYKLKRLWNPNDKPNDEINQLMQDTFDERRKMIILDSSPVKLIKEQFPFLFCLEEVKNELDRIFYPGKCEEFIENMKKYTPHILYYKEDGDKVKEVFDIIAKARDRAKTQVQKTYAEVVGSVFLLAKLLDEDFGFIHLSDYGHSSKDLYPYIDASLYSLNKLFFDDILFHIKVEGEELCEASNFPEAVLCLMATFFIFNIDYPPGCRCTLTVIEKVFLEANDTMEMDDKTEQWIKLLTMKKSKAQPFKQNIDARESRSKKLFFKR